MEAVVTSADVDHEIATLRCLIAQRIHLMEREDRDARHRPAADAFLRQLMRRDDDLRRRAARAAGTRPDA